MKRKDALRKLRTICQRLDEVDPEQFFVIPVRMYLYGSLLTDKPNPGDMDLLFEYRERPDRDPEELVYRLSYGEPLPFEQACTYLRRGMKMIRFEALISNVESWLEGHFFPADTPVRLVWEPGLDWQSVVDEIEAHPITWNAALEERHKYLQETASQLAEAQGKLAAMEWLQKQI
jgi:hypothetical protein